MTPYRIAIIGGGCSGTLTAIHLLQASISRTLHITIVEKHPEIGRGLAYSVPSDRCKLNVPISGMSAFPNHPDNFFEWLRSREPGTTADQFVSRRLYGEYLAELLSSLTKTAQQNSLEIIRDEVLDLEFLESSNTFRITCALTGGREADACILALGNIERARFEGHSASNAFYTPYQASSYEGLHDLREILIVGTGLTAIDCILEAEGRGFRGRYTMVSRHARLPLPHEAAPAHNGSALQLPDINSGLSLRALVKSVHSQARIAGTSQAIMVALRPHTQTIWRSLSTEDKRRFLRHVRPLWDIHRHRIPKPHHETLESLIREGRLEILQGGVRPAVGGSASKARVDIEPKPPSHRDFNRIFLCAGPESDLSKVSMPLMQTLIRRGILVPGELQLGAKPGVSTLPQNARPRFRLIGPLQREELWELTAVREIRMEAEKIAKEFAQLVSDTNQNHIGI